LLDIPLGILNMEPLSFLFFQIIRSIHGVMEKMAVLVAIMLKGVKGQMNNVSIYQDPSLVLFTMCRESQPAIGILSS
jgi:hypothetical protein